ncbi:DUF892 family protein [Sinorhizobium terangae]|uniref:DUF892 family protein n=1 Tax=Sinorhizobium terangae TaxID=110322 RepID=UPI003D15F2E7
MAAWPDVPKHFSGYDGSRHIAHPLVPHGMVGLVHDLELGKNANTWMPPNGQADSARAAALEAEACYDAVLRCEWPIILLTKQSGRLEDYPELRARIAAHVQAKCDHVAMLEQCLQQLDASTAKDVPSRDMVVRKRFSAPVSPPR